MRNRLLRVACLALGTSAATTVLGDGPYRFTIDPQASSLQSSISVHAPSTGTLIGDFDAASNPMGTRTKPGFFGAFGDTENVPVPLSIEFVVEGDNTTQPTGTFDLRLDMESGEAWISGLSIDLLGSTEPAIAMTANLNWSTFRTRNPTCLVPGGVTIPLPLGEAGVSVLAAEQPDGEAQGAAVPGESGSVLVSIPMEVSVSFAASFLDQEVPPTQQVVPIVFVATIAFDAQGVATIQASLDGFELTQQQPGPIGEPFNLPFSEPLCGGSLIFTLQLQSLTADASMSAAIAAIGQKTQSCPCDWDQSGSIGVPDIFAFLSSWFALDPAADFDGQGGVGVPDIFAFLACWFAHPAGCS